MIITIDGPVASGKSSVARALAQRFNIFYLYTGLLYRAVAFILQRYENRIINSDRPFAASEQDLYFVREIVYSYNQGAASVTFRGDDITALLCDASLDQIASLVSADPAVRNALLDFQRAVAQQHGVIADGRDCGSVIFPQADLKFFLTASVDVRARRVMADAARKATKLDFQAVREEIIQRDKRDMERTIAPLMVPDGAVIVDNSDMTLNQTIEAIAEKIESTEKTS